MQQYLIPASDHMYEQMVKKSRFITHISHTPSIEEAKVFIQQIKAQFSDARHNCWAFVAGAPENSLLYGCSDDGEPSGTAGKPILAQLAGSGVGEVTAVVTRYFGGIKLGTGGLVKAYGGAVQQALKQLPTEIKVPTLTLSFQVPFELQSLFEVSIGQFVAQMDERHYTTHLIANVICPAQAASELVAYLFDISKGKIIRRPGSDN